MSLKSHRDVDRCPRIRWRERFVSGDSDTTTRSPRTVRWLPPSALRPPVGAEHPHQHILRGGESSNTERPPARWVLDERQPCQKTRRIARSRPRADLAGRGDLQLQHRVMQGAFDEQAEPRQWAIGQCEASSPGSRTVPTHDGKTISAAVRCGMANGLHALCRNQRSHHAASIAASAAADARASPAK